MTSEVLNVEQTVGSAGTLTETSYSIFVQHEEGGPLYYVPVRRGTPIGAAVAAVFAEYPDAREIVYEV